MANRGGYLKGREDKMGDISNTQFFRAVQEEKKLEASQVLEQVYTSADGEGLQPDQSDCRIYYVWRSDLYYQPQECQKPDYEGRA